MERDAPHRGRSAKDDLMLKLGGWVGYTLLDAIAKRIGTEGRDYGNNDPFEGSHIDRKFGSALFERISGKVVLDYGCGRGADAVRIALGGAAVVYGIDINEGYLKDARTLAQRWGVAERCIFLTSDGAAGLEERIDHIISVDAFEHFQNPQSTLTEMYALLKPGGSVIANWGPPWGHPYGAHMGHFCRLPWIHFIFSERTVLAVREQYETDGAQRYEDTVACVNRMTVRRFYRLIENSKFVRSHVALRPVWGLSRLANNPLTRELFTSEVECEMLKPSPADHVAAPSMSSVS
jgi:ubiquinone/menaquinone biosynthesis C-methylase UbiE